MAGRRVAFGLLALALLLAQALALVHRVSHATDLSGPAAHAAHPDAHPHAHEVEGGLASLFPHDAGELDCRVLDSLGHDGLAALPSLALPALVLPGVLAWATGECVARWAALFDARGPPFSR